MIKMQRTMDHRQSKLNIHLQYNFSGHLEKGAERLQELEDQKNLL